MKIEISSKSMDLTPSLTAYTEEKIGMLEKHVQKLELEGNLHIKIRIGRATEHHHKGDVFEASADLMVPGTNLHADRTSENIHTAIDSVRDALIEEVEKYKTKHSPS